ncbi:chemotaxis-specific protein-glutamate methyltransferase CheB [bacterium]|nr:chemotaxis-specific protein-glutamate methyltransferase CheB [bacterium]
MARTRVLVVEDSLTVRKYLVEVLSADPELEVVGEAADGVAAIALCESLRPDVITLDIVMPRLNGLETTCHVMAHCPTPILIVSGSLNRGEAYETCEALAAGAVDVLEKPNGALASKEWERKLCAAVKLVSRIKVIRHPLGRLRAASRTPALPNTLAPRKTPRLVALGASTGGPGVIREILEGLDPSFSLPILLVLHIGEPFGASFVEWLASFSPLPVKAATDGMLLPFSGCVIVAPPGRHLVATPEGLRLTEAPARHACRPSVDVLFESVAKTYGEGAIGCLLTGMGRDGAEGLLAIKQAGGHTIAQDEASSVVFGMPREAIKLGAAAVTLPPFRIAQTLQAFSIAQAPDRRFP